MTGEMLQDVHHVLDESKKALLASAEAQCALKIKLAQVEAENQALEEKCDRLLTKIARIQGVILSD